MILSPKEVAQIDLDQELNIVGGTQFTAADLLETVQFYQSLDEAKALCGHPERYSYTEDGGKHIICLICERQEWIEEAKGQAFERDILS